MSETTKLLGVGAAILLLGPPIMVLTFWAMMWGLELTVNNLPWPERDWLTPPNPHSEKVNGDAD